jgi:hypothetical protein
MIMDTQWEWVPNIRFGPYSFGEAPPIDAVLSLVGCVELESLAGDAVLQYEYEDPHGRSVYMVDGCIYSVVVNQKAIYKGFDLIGASEAGARASIGSDPSDVDDIVSDDGVGVSRMIIWYRLGAHVIVDLGGDRVCRLSVNRVDA